MYKQNSILLLQKNNRKIGNRMDIRELQTPCFVLDEKEFENNVNMYVSNERIDLKIAFESSVLREVVNQFGQDINVNKCFDGRIEAFIKDVALSDGLIGWIMMLQDKVEVVFPLSLKEIVKTRIRAMLRIYE